MALTQIADAGLKTPASDLQDNEKIVLGTGNDLEIYHSGSDSRIIDNGTGSLYIGGSQVELTNTAVNEVMLKAVPDGAVELYHDNTKKFETTSYGSASAGQLRVTSSNATTVGFSCGDAGTGLYNSGSNAIGYSANGTQKWNINSSGDLRLVDSVKATFGTGDDLQLYHDGSNSTIKNVSGGGVLTLKNEDNAKLQLMTQNSYPVEIKTNAENAIICNANGAVELYYDNTKKFETTSTGVKLTGSGNLLELDGGNAAFSLQLKETSGAYQRLGFQKSNNLLQLGEFNNAGDTFTEVMKVDAANNVFGAGDNIKLNLGAGDDLQLYHNGTHCYIQSSTGALLIDSDNLQLRDKANGDIYFHGVAGGKAELRYDNNTRFETTSDGVSVTGDLRILNDGDYIGLGTGNDLQIHHDGTNSKINNSTGGLFLQTDGDFKIEAQDGGKDMIHAVATGAVELHYNGEKVCYTAATGLQVANTDGNAELMITGSEGNGAMLYLSADDGDDHSDNFRLDVNTSGTCAIQTFGTGSWVSCLAAYDNGAVDLYYGGSIKLGTKGDGVYTSGKVYIGLYQNQNGFSSSSDGSGSTTMYIGNQSITTSSDKRLKENIVNTELVATSELKKVRVVDFTWNDPSDTAINNRNSRGKWTGCLAQEIVEIFPHAVNAPRPEGKEIDNDSKDIWGMEYQHLVPILIKGFQEQQAEIETLKTKVAALEAA